MGAIILENPLKHYLLSIGRKRQDPSGKDSMCGGIGLDARKMQLKSSQGRKSYLKLLKKEEKEYVHSSKQQSIK